MSPSKNRHHLIQKFSKILKSKIQMKLYFSILFSAISARDFPYFNFRDLFDAQPGWRTTSNFQDAVTRMSNLFTSQYGMPDVTEDLVPFLFNLEVIQDENFISFKNELQQGLVEDTLTSVQNDQTFMAANPDFDPAFIRNYINGGNNFMANMQAGKFIYKSFVFKTYFQMVNSLK